MDSFTKLIFFFFSFSLTGFAQVNLDSTYTSKELYEMLSKARKNYISKADKTVPDHQYMADLYYQLANYAVKRYDYKKSMEYYTSSLPFYRQTNDTIQINKVQEIIAQRYRRATLYQESLDLYQELLDYYTLKDNEKKVANILSEMAKVHGDRGNTDMEQSYINKAIAINKSLRDSSLQFVFLMEKMDNYERLYEIDSSLLFAFKAFRLANKLKDKKKISEALFSIGYINRIKSNYTRAVKYLYDAEIIIPYEPYSEMRRKLYKELSNCYDKINDYNNAYKYSEKYAELNDSILQLEKDESIQSLTIKHSTDQKTKEILDLERQKSEEVAKVTNQRRALYILTAGLTLLLILIYYLVRFYTQRIRAARIINTQKEEINNQKIRELEDNMKINSMQSMIEGQEIERERIARDLHDSLGGLLSTIKLQFDSVKAKNENIKNIKEYKNANKLLDTAVEEVRSISHNLQPGALMNLGLIPAINDLINRFDGEHYPDIDFQHYLIPEKMNNMFTLSIYRIIQELLHNAIKHAKATEILLQINKENDEIVIQLEDDGVGFDIENLERIGMGLENIKSRINYLKGTLNIDSKKGEGTSYLIHLKFKK